MISAILIDRTEELVRRAFLASPARRASWLGERGDCRLCARISGDRVELSEQYEPSWASYYFAPGNPIAVEARAREKKCVDQATAHAINQGCLPIAINEPDGGIELRWRSAVPEGARNSVIVRRSHPTWELLCTRAKDSFAEMLEHAGSTPIAVSPPCVTLPANISMGVGNTEAYIAPDESPERNYTISYHNHLKLHAEILRRINAVRDHFLARPDTRAAARGSDGSVLLAAILDQDARVVDILASEVRQPGGVWTPVSTFRFLAHDATAVLAHTRCDADQAELEYAFWSTGLLPTAVAPAYVLLQNRGARTLYPIDSAIGSEALTRVDRVLASKLHGYPFTIRPEGGVRVHARLDGNTFVPDRRRGVDLPAHTLTAIEATRLTQRDAA